MEWSVCMGGVQNANNILVKHINMSQIYVAKNPTLLLRTSKIATYTYIPVFRVGTLAKDRVYTSKMGRPKCIHNCKIASEPAVHTSLDLPTFIGDRCEYSIYFVVPIAFQNLQVWGFCCKSLRAKNRFPCTIAPLFSAAPSQPHDVQGSHTAVSIILRMSSFWGIHTWRIRRQSPYVYKWARL